jgi:hypothetical protein
MTACDSGIMIPLSSLSGATLGRLPQFVHASSSFSRDPSRRWRDASLFLDMALATAPAAHQPGTIEKRFSATAVSVVSCAAQTVTDNALIY